MKTYLVYCVQHEPRKHGFHKRKAEITFAMFANEESLQFAIDAVPFPVFHVIRTDDAGQLAFALENGR